LPQPHDADASNNDQYLEDDHQSLDGHLAKSYRRAEKNNSPSRITQAII
jgi:hypothetical protein